MIISHCDPTSLLVLEFVSRLHYRLVRGDRAGQTVYRSFRLLRGVENRGICDWACGIQLGGLLRFGGGSPFINYCNPIVRPSRNELCVLRKYSRLWCMSLDTLCAFMQGDVSEGVNVGPFTY